MTTPWTERVRCAITAPPKTLYHATTPKKLQRYKTTGTILPPIRGFDTPQAARNFMRRTGRTLLLEIRPRECWPLPDHHTPEGLAWWALDIFPCDWEPIGETDTLTHRHGVALTPLKIGQVWPSRQVVGWSESRQDAPVYPTVDASALSKVYSTDAHFVPYYLEGSANCPRLTKDVDDSYPIKVQLVPLDCEPEDHSPTPEWRENFRAVMDTLKWAYYETRGGARAIFALEEAVSKEQFVLYQRRAALLLSQHEVRVDPTTLNQWHRCYRLPYVLRDGVEQSYPADRLNAIPFVRGDSLPSLINQTFEDVRLHWSDIIEVGEGQRNDYLTRAAGSLRNAGLSGRALLEELQRINEEKCAVPLPIREVAAICRSAESWDMPTRPTEEVVKNEDPLQLGSEVEVARRLLEEMPQDTIGDRGMLWGYNPSQGIWECSDINTLAKKAAAFDGFPIHMGKDKYKPLKLSDRACRGVANIAIREHRTQGFFDFEAPGVVFANGFYDANTSTLMPHCSEHRARFAVPFEYEPEVVPEAFVAFLRQIFSYQDDAEEIVQLVREIIGVFACGLATKFQRAFILKGNGSNGKSVLLDVIASLFSDKIVTSIAPQDWGNEYRRARLSHARINLVSELPSETEMLSSEKIKGVISGDSTEAREIFSAPFDFRPRAGHIFSTNILPGVRDHSSGFWRRWTVIPFNRKIHDHEKDRNLTARLIETQRSQILSWAMDAIKGVLRRGNYAIPASCRAETALWRANADQIACFLGDDDIASSEVWELGAKQMYQRYVEWAKTNGHKQLSGRTFGERIKSVEGVDSKRTRAGVVYFRG